MKRIKKEYKTVNIDNLKPYINNAKEHPEWQVDQIRNSIENYGYISNIVVDPELNVIAGHGRLMALQEIGETEVEVEIVHGLTEKDKRGYMIVDNKLAMNTGFNNDLLITELKALKDDGLDLSLLGFKDGELDVLFSDIGDKDLGDFFSDHDTEQKEGKVIVCPSCGEEIKL